jgi:hypothetical protein
MSGNLSQYFVEVNSNYCISFFDNLFDQKCKFQKRLSGNRRQVWPKECNFLTYQTWKFFRLYINEGAILNEIHQIIEGIKTRLVQGNRIVEIKIVIKWRCRNLENQGKGYIF